MRSADVKGLCVLALAGTGQAFAQVNPTYDTFGAAPSFVNYSGSGIPTDPSANRVLTIGSDTISMGLAAWGRYSNPQLTSAAGVYTATPGDQ